MDIRSFKIYEQKLFKGVSQKEQKIEDPENEHPDNVLKHIAIVKAFVNLVNEKIKKYQISMQKLYGDIDNMELLINQQIENILKEIMP